MSDALSRNLLLFPLSPHLLDLPLLPGGERVGDPSLFCSWLTDLSQGWQSMIPPVNLLLQLPDAPQPAHLLSQCSLGTSVWVAASLLVAGEAAGDTAFAHSGHHCPGR